MTTDADHQIEFDAAERERIRGALRRGQNLEALAGELDMPLPALEIFVSGRAHLAPRLLAAIAGILARSPAPVIPALRHAPHIPHPRGLRRETPCS